MRNGTPSITTSIGAEGLAEDFGGLNEDNPQELVDKTIKLYTDENLWMLKQNQGFKLLKKFDKFEQQKLLIDKVAETIKQLNDLRFNNFTGVMLQHQSLQGTKYMSKWIEEKNKKD